MFAQALGRTVEHHLARDEDDDPVGHCHDVINIVRAEYYASSLTGSKRLSQADPLSGIQTDGGLVQNKKRWLAY